MEQTVLQSGYVRHFVAANLCDMSRFAPFTLGAEQFGYVTRELARDLSQATDVFTAQGDGIALLPAFKTFEQRSEALSQATRWIAEKYGKSLRQEKYPVTQEWEHRPAAQIDRAAVPWFGVRAWGVHVNGFVRKADGIHIWVGKRAADRPMDPGKLDHLVAGGMPIGLTLEENLRKESYEEAGLDAGLAMTAKPAPPLSYCLERNGGLRRDTLFIYDLELPEDFIPRNTDGEVESFTLMPIAEIAQMVRETDAFKFNCNLVIIDFLMRHGFIRPQDQEYCLFKDWLAAKPLNYKPGSPRSACAY